MNLEFATIRTRDLAAALNFYQGALGLNIDRRFQAGPNEIVFLAAGGIQLELVAGPESGEKRAGDNLSLGFAVGDLDSTLAGLAEAGITPVSGPASPNPHVRFALIRDPDGVLIQLTEHLA